MLVHDIRKNETRVIDFRETAPTAIHEEMMLSNLDHYVRHFSGVLSYTCRSLLREQKTVELSLFCGEINMCTRFLLLHFSLACWWVYQACSVGCTRHTSSMAGRVN